MESTRTQAEPDVHLPAQRGTTRPPRHELPPPATVRPAPTVSGSLLSPGLRRLPFVVMAVDALALGLALLVAAVGQSVLDLFPAGSLAESPVGPPMVLASGALMAVGWLLTIASRGGYELTVFGAGTDEYRRVVHSGFVAAAIVGIGCYLLRADLPRGFFSLLVLGGIGLLLVGRYTTRCVIKVLRERGSLLHRVLIVGSETHVDDIARVLDRQAWLGYDVIGALVSDHAGAATFTGVPVVGRPDQVAVQALAHHADIVFVAGGAVDSAQQLRDIAWQLEDVATQLVVAPGVTDVSAERVSIRPVGGLPLIHLDKPRSAGAAKWGKRAFDVVGSTLLLVAFAPAFAVAAWQIRRHDGGPVLFRQERVGRNGERFAVLKLRTMVTDAESLLDRLHAEQGYEDGLFKMVDDPRVTRPGRWLRRYSVDELPQLLNVLRGEMSLVGPRPPLPLEVARYDDAVARRLRARPGMTGLWQVSGRSDLSWSEAIRLDLYYVDNWSMVQDLTILARTLGAVLRSRGAY